MGTEVVVALIAAVTAVVTSVVSTVWSWRNLQQNMEHQRALSASEARVQEGIQQATADLQRRSEIAARDLEQLRSTLQLAEQTATSRMSYELEGRKRLYDQYEPLRFQLMEAALHAGWRVQSLARSARRGDIRPDGGGWLEDKTGYYLAVTIYELALPSVLYRILRRRLTFVDFSLDARIEWEYRLAKGYALGLSNDFSLATVPDGVLPYDPGVADWHHRRAISPAEHWRQGLSIGILDSFLEQLTQRGPDGTTEAISFGTFYDRIRGRRAEASSQLRVDPLLEQYLEVADVFQGFHPTTRPVLWRVLLYQVVFAYAFFRSWESRSDPAPEGSHQIPDLPEALIQKYAVEGSHDIHEEIRIATLRARKEIDYAFSL